MTEALLDATRELPILNDADLGFPPADPPTPGSKTGDPQAPYGYTSAGTPRKPPGRKPAAGKPTAKTAPPKPAPKPATKPAPPKPASTKVDYRAGIQEFGEGIASLVALAGVARNKPVLIVDAATIDSGMPHLAEVGNAAADKFPIVANILDKVLAAGPHATAIGGVIIMVAQLAVNHGLIPVGLVPGTVSADDLAAVYMAKLANKMPAATQNAAASFATAAP